MFEYEPDTEESVPRDTISDLPPAIVELANGRDLEAKVGQVFLLITMSESGWPHVAMLSVGELVALSSDRLVLALWQGTETGSNLLRERKATILVVTSGAGYSIELLVEPAGTIKLDSGDLDRFHGHVIRVLSDEVGYARLTSGISFTLPDKASVIARWRKTVRAATESCK